MFSKVFRLGGLFGSSLWHFGKGLEPLSDLFFILLGLICWELSGGSVFDDRVVLDRVVGWEGGGGRPPRGGYSVVELPSRTLPYSPMQQEEERREYIQGKRKRRDTSHTPLPCYAGSADDGKRSDALDVLIRG